MTVAINGVDKQGVYVNGVQVKQALNAANETVNKGVYNATTLSGVDADLQAANIKLAENIFGFVGTLAAGGVETIEAYSNATLVAGATYTPGDSGIFCTANKAVLSGVEYYSTGDTAWHAPYAYSFRGATVGIGNGSQFRIRNAHGSTAGEYYMFRHYMSTGTYERATDVDLAATAAYTPAVSGFFAFGGEDPAVKLQVQYGVLGWDEWNEATNTSDRVTGVLGDGTNLRIYNTDIGAWWTVVMRAVMT